MKTRLTRRSAGGVVIVPLLAILAACGDKQIPEAARQEAQQKFTTFCSTCHGVDGTGNGPGSAGLPVKPRNYTDAAWQKTVTDEHIEKTILKGGAATGLSPLMPPNADLEGKPDVVRALREIVRNFAKPDGK